MITAIPGKKKNRKLKVGSINFSLRRNYPDQVLRVYSQSRVIRDTPKVFVKRNYEKSCTVLHSIATGPEPEVICDDLPGNLATLKSDQAGNRAVMVK